MLRSIGSKVAWVGRTASMVFGVALVMALVLGVATMAFGANGKPFLLGKKNVASAISTLVKQGPGPALKLQVGSGQPPLAVNSSARVANLNAATAGRADSAASANTATSATSASSAADSEMLDGKDSDEFAPAYKRTVVVSPVGTDSENGTALLDALNGITDPSASNPYLLYIEPGTYDLGNRTLTMKEHVDIKGAGELRTLISGGAGTYNNSGMATVRGSNNAKLRFLTVRNTDDYCSIAIYNLSTSPRLTHVTAEATGVGGTIIGIWNESGSPTMTDVTATASRGRENYGMLISGSDSPTMTDVTVTASGGTQNYGVRTRSGNLTIRQSKLSGSTNSLLQDSTYGNAKVAITELEGPVSRSAGTLKCFNNYDNNLAAVTCP